MFTASEAGRNTVYGVNYVSVTPSRPDSETINLVATSCLL